MRKWCSIAWRCTAISSNHYSDCENRTNAITTAMSSPQLKYTQTKTKADVSRCCLWMKSLRSHHDLIWRRKYLRIFEIRKQTCFSTALFFSVLFLLHTHENLKQLESQEALWRLEQKAVKSFDKLKKDEVTSENKKAGWLTCSLFTTQHYLVDLDRSPRTTSTRPMTVELSTKYSIFESNEGA